ncbi:MAG: DUF342 domain-containing protein, partial [Gammaproteobacteria bacterium]|nr:DUF342 domain-containing protein [Gammaproteobacteria bacterium]
EGFVKEKQVTSVLQSQAAHFRQHQKIVTIGEMLLEARIINQAQHDAVAAILAQQQHKTTSPKDPLPLPLDPSPSDSEATPTEDQATATAEPYRLTIADDHLSATLTLTLPRLGHKTLPRTYNSEDLPLILRTMLEEYGITYGVDDLALQQFSDGLIAAFHTEEGAEAPLLTVTVAQGIAPQPGENAHIECHFNTDPLGVGAIDENGIIDFKNRGEITEVSADTLIATLTPAVEGVTGIDIYGSPVHPPRPLQLKIKEGDGIRISDDGRQAYAAITGIPFRLSRTQFIVAPIFTIAGDVDYHSGHVDYHGEIRVSGEVKDSFSVSGGRLIANEIGAATIDIAGDVIVMGGIVGATIRAGGNLKAHFIHNSQIEIGGSVMVKREIMESQLLIGGKLLAGQCSLFSSKISTCNDMLVGDVGNDAATAPVTLGFGNCDYLRQQQRQLFQKKKQAEATLNTTQATLSQSEARNHEINHTLANHVQQQDKQMVELRQLKESLAALKNSDLESERARHLQKRIKGYEMAYRDLDSAVEDLFTEQDKLAQGKKDLLQQITDSQTALAAVEEELPWLQQQLQTTLESKPRLKIFGTLYPRNTLEGAHSQMTSNNQLARLEIYENSTTDREGSKTWRIGMRPLK